MILPGLLRIRTGLTPLAASGLVIIMIGATVLTPTLLGMDVIMALPNVVRWIHRYSRLTRSHLKIVLDADLLAPRDTFHHIQAQLDANLVRHF